MAAFPAMCPVCASFRRRIRYAGCSGSPSSLEDALHGLSGVSQSPLLPNGPRKRGCQPASTLIHIWPGAVHRLYLIPLCRAAEVITLVDHPYVLHAEGIDVAAAAGLPVAFGTAHLALTERAKLQAGQVLLVLGAGGGVGAAAVQVGQRLEQDLRCVMGRSRNPHTDKSAQMKPSWRIMSIPWSLLPSILRSHLLRHRQST